MPDEERDLWAEHLAREVELGRCAAAQFPYALVETTGERALEVWQSLRRQGKGTPLVLGGYGDIYRLHLRLLDKDHTAQTVLQAASRVRFPDDLLAMRAAQRAKIDARLTSDHAQGRFLEDVRYCDMEWPPHGPWPDKAYEEPPLCVATAWDFSSWDRSQGLPAPRRPLEKVYIALLPGTDAAEGPAHLLWGGWNDVPPSQMLVAALRSWRERYGAELVGIGHDTWSLRVDRPPTSRQEALTLAAEMVELCGDLLGEVKTLEGQAALVMANSWWNFWWD